MDSQLIKKVTFRIQLIHIIVLLQQNWMAHKFLMLLIHQVLQLYYHDMFRHLKMPGLLIVKAMQFFTISLQMVDELLAGILIAREFIRLGTVLKI